MKMPFRIQALLAASAIFLPATRAFIVGNPARIFSTHLERITGWSQVPSEGSTLKYRTGDQPNKIFNDDKQSKQDAYQTVAELDPQWYEKFVTNVLGEDKVKEVGLPVSVPLQTKPSKLRGEVQDNSTASSLGNSDFSIGSVINEALEADKTAVKNFTDSSGRDKDNSTIQREGNIEVLPVDRMPLATAKDPLALQKGETSAVESRSETKDEETPVEETRKTLNTTEPKEATKSTLQTEEPCSEDTADSRSVPLLQVDRKEACSSESLNTTSSRRKPLADKDNTANAPAKSTNETMSAKDIAGGANRNIVEENKRTLTNKDEAKVHNISANPSPQVVRADQPKGDELLFPGEVSKSPSNKSLHEKQNMSTTKEEKSGKEQEITLESTEGPRTTNKSGDEETPTQTNVSASASRESEKVLAEVESKREEPWTMEARKQLSQPETRPQNREIFPESDLSDVSIANEKSLGGSAAAVENERKAKVQAVEKMAIVYTLDGASVSEPLTTLTNLGYTKEDILTLQSDAVDLIIADRMVKPKSGIPRSWQKSPSIQGSLSDQADKVKIVPLADLEEEQVETKPATSKSKNEHRPTPATEQTHPSDQHQELASAKSTRQDEIQENRRPEIPKSESVPPVNASTRESGVEADMAGTVEEFEPPRDEDMEGAKTDSVDGSDRDIGKPTQDDEVAIYRDPLLGKMRVTPLKNLALLGYTKEEISNMRPDVLGTIATERRPRPKKGIPSQWCITSEDDGDNIDGSEVVKIVPRSDIGGYKKSRPRARRIENDTSERGPSSEGRNERRRERRPLRSERQKKTIYNVRQSGTIPGSFGRQSKPWVSWPDRDKFREMLRTEAELRVRLTSAFGGDDFIDAIKDECDMRLGLYEGWLQKLERGVGDPILPLVPPRNERYVVPPKRENREERDKPSKRKRRGD